jgi:hypothetical protein
MAASSSSTNYSFGLLVKFVLFILEASSDQLESAIIGTFDLSSRSRCKTLSGFEAAASARPTSSRMRTTM